MFDRSRNIITFSSVFIIFDALAALVIAFSSTGRNSVKTILIVCTVIALPFMTAVLRHSIYILRLKKFLAELPEEPEEEPFKPTFTVVGKEPEPATEPEPVSTVSEDPNKLLSPDEIAALFAAADPAPKKAEKKEEPEPVSVTPVSDDPNKQLTPEEIAALFASMG